ncbi:uncharacterized protein G2W53_041221 [Senna tora]|uniref:Uncharacterized protein n=1 Tax=Senna tora TaxID=362788 RepID=A0A834SGR5_9FABA|nr:uncharacterized protein G2W53_041221 [Senna tora]
MGWKEIGVWVERERRDGFGGVGWEGSVLELRREWGEVTVLGLERSEAHGYDFWGGRGRWFGFGGLVVVRLMATIFGVEEAGGSVLVAEKGELVRFWRRLGFEGVAMEVWFVGMKKRR